MIKVKVTIKNPKLPLKRQTPNNSGVWENCQFYINEPVEICDYWVVYDGLDKKEETICPEGNTLLITGEPPTIKQYKQHFLNQFSTVITCHKNMKHKNMIFQQQGLPWHILFRIRNHDILSFSKCYDELISLDRFHKDKEISLIVSDKCHSIGQKQRIEFLKILKDHFGNRIDVFGRGINEIEEKWDSLSRYKYHVVLENCSIADYWTEKLADAYLAGCYPIYYGCTNIEKYFNSNAFTKIDITNPDKSSHIIESCIKEAKYEKAEHQIKRARTDVLNRYNVFALISEFVNNNLDNLGKSKYNKIKLSPESSTHNISFLARKVVSNINFSI